MGRLRRGIDDGDLKPGVTGEWDGRERKARGRERERETDSREERRKGKKEGHGILLVWRIRYTRTEKK